MPTYIRNFDRTALCVTARSRLALPLRHTAAERWFRIPSLTGRLTNLTDRTHWLDTINRAGDDHLGQTLIRLAGLAEAVHRFDQTQDLTRKDLYPVHGRLEASASNAQALRLGRNLCAAKPFQRMKRLLRRGIHDAV